jgi:signal transduction histidine kinase/DNA-binding response OmpR family regulator
LRSVYRTCLAATLLGTLYSAVIDYRLGVQIWTLALDATLLVVVLTLVLAWRHGSTTASRLLLTIVAIIGVEGIRLAILLGAHADNVFTVEAGPWAMVLTAPMILISISQRARAMQAQVLLAQQANAAKSDFLARVSHDLRSPLNTIIGYAGMLRRGSGRLSLREGVDGIEASGKRLLGLIDELLDQSRLSAGKLTLHPGPVVLATWLDELRRGNELRAQHSGNRFSLQQDSPLPAVVIMDGDRLWQVLDNLLTNASRHTHQGQITLRVRADAPDDGQVRLHIEVSDTGCGIALAEQQAVFEPFVQGSQPAQGPERRRPGVGLGLPIAKDLVHLMGGELQLQSEPGQGSTFRFSVLCGQSALPAPPKAPDHPAAHPAAPTAPALPLHQLAALADSPRVLVVEDNPMARRALTDLLAHAGFQPLEAASGQEAEAMLDEADAIVTDQHMAGGDGWHVLRTARAHHASMPIILLSAVAPQRPPDLAPSTCFDLVLKKPAGEQELSDHLLMLIERERRTALCRPPAAALHALRELIAQGAVTDIETWCDELEATQAECQAYARLVRHAVLALDFTRLQALATDSPPSAA